jgi:hypothetical protein
MNWIENWEFFEWYEALGYASLRTETGIKFFGHEYEATIMFFAFADTFDWRYLN